jgi:hypothetical protein
MGKRRGVTENRRRNIHVGLAKTSPKAALLSSSLVRFSMNLEA